MKTVVIYFRQPAALDEPLNDPFYFDSYRGFAQHCQAQGVELVIARGDSYLGNLQFQGGWTFGHDTLQRIDTVVQADIVYNKAVNLPFHFESDALVLNDPEFDRITDDKWLMYETFQDLMPPTFKISDDNWRDVVNAITTEKIVLKPTHGLGGKGIVISETATLDFPALKLAEPYVAQPFIDSSHGIPGICDSYHDLRILFFNDEPKLSYIRTPKPGSLLSNISQGASAFAVDVALIPASIIAMARSVDRHYEQFRPRHYSADFFMDINRPYLVETNTQPGFPRRDAEGETFQQQYYEYLFNLLNTAVVDRAK